MNNTSTPASAPPSFRVVTLCTGNATRSVIAQLWLQKQRPDLVVVGGGTLSIEGLPMSPRTRNALMRVGLTDPGHRSHQLVADDLVDVDLVLAMEVDHVNWIRREHPEVADRTATLRRLLSDMQPGPPAFATRLAALELSSVKLASAEVEDVIDPAGGDQDEFDRCADELAALLAEFVQLLDPPPEDH